MNDMSMAWKPPQADIDTGLRSKLLATAEQLVPGIDQRSRAAEQQRCCPRDSIDAFVAAGLFQICLPSRFGGYDMGWDVRCEVAQILARGCGAQAWVYNQLSDATHLAALFPLEAQEDVWSRDPQTRIACSFDPVGRGRRVDGGVRYAGKHNFASGIDWADWLVCGGRIEGEDAPYFFLLPKSSVRVIDNWDVMGLAGTGSKGFELDDVFVPGHRILPVARANDGTGPGAAVNPAAVFRMPRNQVAVTGFAAVAVGIAEGFLAQYCDYSSGRRSRGEQVAAQMGTQISTGGAAAQIMTADTIYKTAIRDVMRCLDRGEVVTSQQRLQTQLSASYAARLAVDAVQGLLIDAGGRALTVENAMQRRFRDLMAVVSHRGLVWNNAAAAYGRHLLGVA